MTANQCLFFPFRCFLQLLSMGLLLQNHGVDVTAFMIHRQPSNLITTTTTTTTTTTIAQSLTTKRKTELFMSTTPQKKKGYEPKWKKKKTLAEQLETKGIQDLAAIGLKGNVAVLFKQGNQTISTMALEGQLLRDVATQAGQFIKYGCGKGECGTCECLVDGKWIRPCTTKVPSVPQGQEYIVQIKDIKSKAVSSGKFYSLRSFIMGFWNNLLGMVGFVKYRRYAKQNRLERKEYEDLIRQKTLAKKIARTATTTEPDDTTTTTIGSTTKSLKP